MRAAFWKSSAVLLNYKRPLAIALVGAVISAACFGAGLATMVPTIKILLGTKTIHPTIIKSSPAGDDATLYFPQSDQVVEINVIEPGQVEAQAIVRERDNRYHAPLPRYLNDAANDQGHPQYVRELAQWAADRVPTDPFKGFALVMAIVAVLALVGSIARYIHELIIITICQRAVMVWRLRMFRRLIHSPMERIFVTGTADHVGRLVADTNVLEGGYRAVLGKTIAEVTKGIAALFAALYIDPVLTLITLIGAPPIAIFLRKFSKAIRRASKQAMKQRGRIIALLHESLGGMPVVKVHDAEGYERRRYNRATRNLFKQEMKKRQARALASPVIETLALYAVIGAATIAAWYMFKHDRPPENLFLVLLMLAAAGNSLKPLTALQTQIAEADAAAIRIMEVTNLPVEETHRDSSSQRPELARHGKSVMFDNVSYHYPGKDAQALDQVTLQVPFGSTVALVGSNGSGKTTLLSMLPRLLNPTQGRVLIDGQDISQLNLRSLRKQMAIVTQQSVLFEGTIADNIAYGRRHTPREKIIAAAKAAHADEFIQTLPMGYDTKLGEDGIGLSGGQRQRICIARAMLRDPSILVLDEATSQIDADSEAKINQVVREIRQGRTIFIIAHRLSTVIDADLIVVMDKGRILDQGKHAELLARCELYQTLSRTQLQSA